MVVQESPPPQPVVRQEVTAIPKYGTSGYMNKYGSKEHINLFQEEPKSQMPEKPY